MKKATLALVGFLIVCVTSAPAAAAPLFSDNFEAEALGLNQALDNWTVSDGTIDVIGTGFFDLCGGSPTPARCVDLDGSTGNAGRIESTAFALAPGLVNFTFWLAGNQRGSGLDSVTVSVGSFIEVIELLGTAPFALYSRSFMSGGEMATIVFNHAGGDNVGILLDNVSISQDAAAVPEPASLVLFGTGALMALRRRRAQKSK